VGDLEKRKTDNEKAKQVLQYVQLCMCSMYVSVLACFVPPAETWAKTDL
jgi:hypothetical protein